MSYKTHVHGNRESHSGIVPTKQPNESQGGPQEVVEGRPLTAPLAAEENMEQPNLRRTPSRESEPTGLDRVRRTAKGDGKLKFTALLHLVNTRCERRSAPQQLPGLEEAGGRGSRRGDVGRIGRKPGGTVNGPARENSSRSLSGATVTESLDPEIRWKATTTGNGGAGK